MVYESATMSWDAMYNTCHIYVYYREDDGQTATHDDGKVASSS